MDILRHISTCCTPPREMNQMPRLSQVLHNWVPSPITQTIPFWGVNYPTTYAIPSPMCMQVPFTPRCGVSGLCPNTLYAVKIEPQRPTPILISPVWPRNGMSLPYSTNSFPRHNMQNGYIPASSQSAHVSPLYYNLGEGIVPAGQTTEHCTREGDPESATSTQVQDHRKENLHKSKVPEKKMMKKEDICIIIKGGLETDANIQVQNQKRKGSPKSKVPARKYNNKSLKKGDMLTQSCPQYSNKRLKTEKIKRKPKAVPSCAPMKLRLRHPTPGIRRSLRNRKSCQEDSSNESGISPMDNSFESTIEVSPVFTTSTPKGKEGINSSKRKLYTLSNDFEETNDNDYANHLEPPRSDRKMLPCQLLVQPFAPYPESGDRVDHNTQNSDLYN